MSDDNAVVTDETVRERLVTAIDDTERTTSDFRDMMAGDSDTITLSNGVNVPSIPALVLNRASSLMTRAVDAGGKAVSSADNAKTSESNAKASADSARNAASRVDSSLESMGPLVTRAEESASQAQSSASNALRSQQAAEQAAESASGAALGDVGSALISSDRTGENQSVKRWVERFSSADIVIDNIAALRSRSPGFQGERVLCKYHTFPGFGGGVFVHDPSDQSSSDDGGGVIVTKSGDRYKRVWDDGDRSNVLDWGADPTGKTDVGPACRRMIAADVITLYFPNYRFMVDSTIEGRYTKSNGDIGLKQIQIKGDQFDYYGANVSVACLFAGPNLRHDASRDDVNRSIIDDINKPDQPVVGFSATGWMFNNVRSAKYLSLEGNGKSDSSACGIRTNGYVGRVDHCGFNSFNACVGQLNCDSRVTDCTFTGSKYAAISIAGADSNLITTVTYSRNEHQWCTYGYYASGQVWGSTFEDNIFEACAQQLCNAAMFRACQFLTNWIELGGGKDENGNDRRAFISRTGQESNNNLTFGNTYHYGTWKRDLFSQPDADGDGTPADGSMFGGVSMEKGQIQVRATNGYGITYHTRGISQISAKYIRYPLTIKTGRQYDGGGGSSIVLDSSQYISLKTRRERVEMTPSGSGSSRTALSWPIVVNTSDDSTDGRMEFKPGRNGIPMVTLNYKRTRSGAPSDATGTSRYEVAENTQYLPIMARWTGAFGRGEGDTRETGYFDYSEINNDHVTLVTDHLETRKPKIMVQVENDPDIEFVSWSAIDMYGGSWSTYGVAKGFRFYFRNKDTKEPAIPSAFVVYIQNGY